jgi:hypothetical protein
MSIFNLTTSLSLGTMFVILMLGGIFFMYFGYLIPSSGDSANQLYIITAFSFASSLVLYFLAAYYLSRNPRFLIQFLLGVTMLLLLPTALISTSIMTLTLTNVSG